MAISVPQSAAPNNLRFAEDVHVGIIDGDVMDICKRVKEIDPNLFIVVATRGQEYIFVVMEKCADGVERMVFKTKELNGEIIERLRKMAATPLNVRMIELEKEEAENKRKMEEEASDELFERLGLPMQYQLWHDGFIEHRNKSYPKKGIKPTKT